jgi:hypothetical protein
VTVTHWFYPINPRSQYVLLDPITGSATTVSKENLHDQIEEYPDREDEWVLNSGFRLMQRGDVVWIYVSGLQELTALARVLDVYFGDDDYWHALFRWNLVATRVLAKDPISRSAFGGQHVQSVSRADAQAIPVLKSWLVRRSLDVTADDDGADPASEEDARNRVLSLIVRRQGQHVFRSRLISHYEGRCAVTDETAEEVLEAAHIDPYMGPKSNAPSNGLLLRSDLHILFDKHLIGVDPSGSLVVSDRLDVTSYAEMAGRKLFQPSRTTGRPKPGRLAKHLRRLVGTPLAPQAGSAARSRS